MRGLRSTLLVVVTGIAGLACTDTTGTPARNVVLGANIDRTGSIARPAWHEAVKLAVNHANDGLAQAGGYNGLHFSVEQADSTNTPDVAVTRATELVRDKGAKMLVTDTSADDIAINKLHYDADPANDLNVPMVCMACTSASINNAGATNSDAVQQATLRNGLGWNFRSSMVSTPQGVVLANIARSAANNGDADGNGTFKISVYAIDDPYGNGFFTDIVNGAAAVGITPVIEQVKHPRDADANSYNWAGDVEKLTDGLNEQTMMQDGPPDLVIIVDFPQYAAAITKAYVLAGKTIRIVQTHNFRHDTVVEALGQSVNGQEGTSHVILDGESGNAFNAALEGATGVAAGFWDSNSYDAAMVLLLGTIVAVKDNNLADPSTVTGAQIRDGVKKIHDKSAGAVTIRVGAGEFAKAVQTIKDGGKIDYEGASGPMDWDATGNVVGRIARYRHQNGRFEDVEKFDCVASATCPSIGP